MYKITKLAHSLDKITLFKENNLLFNTDKKKKGKIKPKDIYKFKVWPKYITNQRQRKILSRKMKIPYPVFRFTKVLKKNLTERLFSYLSKVFSDFKKKKKDSKKFLDDTIFLCHGINGVTNLIKKKKLMFVIIANDVNPIECIIWLPALCDAKKVPYVIVKDKSRLGKIVGMKTTSCIGVHSSDKSKLEHFQKIFEKFEDK
mmetsp:Transcript_583/g.1306  ORF Transcript_583/g.1306 Transcript_583/m.1306 type:complete len:201 (+) Transcript_583:467-1069(+)